MHTTMVNDMLRSSPPWTVIDLFSGAGGASAGFQGHPSFEVVGAADAQMGKPSSAPGTLGCNETYAANVGIKPLEVDLGSVESADLGSRLGLTDSPTVLIACPPCTGFSRTNARNHLRDDPRNSLVVRVADFVEEFRPKIVVMENARELLIGRFAHHFSALKRHLEMLGYTVSAETHFLNKFGLPQIRERALIIATCSTLEPRTLADLWDGYRIDEKATTVRRAIWSLPPVGAGEISGADEMHRAPAFRSKETLRRLQAIPHDGGSWRSLFDSPRTRRLMTPTMNRLASISDFGSFPDVYGRLAWDRPSATIKRECSHVGNGRYSHPQQDRLCTVRELAILQGFPNYYRFEGSMSNRYRHVGDAVPPLISRQLASVCEWILTGRRPPMESIILERTHLEPGDIIPT